MTDLSTSARADDTTLPVDEPLYGQAADAIRDQLREPSDLDVAIRVARLLLADYGDSSRDGFSYPEAYGALREALRLLLRALDAEPDGEVLTESRKNPSALDAEPTPLPRKTSGESFSSQEDKRCPAAHPEDPTPCVGPVVVTVLDRTNAGADGCEHHGARLLASLDGGRVYALQDAPDGAAIRVFKAADTTRPVPWVDAPRTRPEQLSRVENRRAGEDR